MNVFLAGKIVCLDFMKLYHAQLQVIENVHSALPPVLLENLRMCHVLNLTIESVHHALDHVLMDPMKQCHVVEQQIVFVNPAYFADPKSMKSSNVHLCKIVSRGQPPRGQTHIDFPDGQPSTFLWHPSVD